MTGLKERDDPLAGGANLHLDAYITQNESAFRYAPSISSLHFIPNDNLLTAINDAKQDIAGENNRYSIPGDVIRLGVLAKRGDLSATWFLAFNMRF